jgi:hypothetical protein
VQCQLVAPWQVLRRHAGTQEGHLTTVFGEPRDDADRIGTVFKYRFQDPRTQLLMDPLESALRLSDWKGRKYRRFNLEFPVLIKIQSDSEATEVEAVSENVSVGGLLVRSTLMIPCNTPVSFILSVHGEHAVRPIHLMGEGDIVRAEGEEAAATFVLAIKCKAPVTQLEVYLPA